MSLKLERIWVNAGKFFFQRLHPLLFLALLATPFLGSLFFLFSQVSEIQFLETKLITTTQRAKGVVDRKNKKERFLKRYCKANPYFLDEHIESLPFLQKEKNRLESLLKHPAWPAKGPIQDRLASIESEKNRLLFKEENIQTNSQVKETEEKQKHPIQIDQEDLQKLLSYLEDLPIGSHEPLLQSPQLIIRNFHLKKQKTPFQNEVFELEMDLLKREFLK